MTRAARDHLGTEPAFAGEAALAALHWMSLGHGYELTGMDVQEAYRYAMEAAQSVGKVDQIRMRLERLFAGDGPTAKWMRRAIGLTDR